MDTKLHQAQPSTGSLRPPPLSLSPETGNGGGPYARRGSGMSEGPITPPMSPGRSEDGGMEDSITVDSQPRFSGPSQPPMSSSFVSQWSPGQGEERMQEGMDGIRPPTPPKQPMRLLEDEQVHIEQRGLLKLKDFEIKGTLGRSHAQIFRCSDQLVFHRNWNFWSRSAGAAENSHSFYAKFLCDESPA